MRLLKIRKDGKVAKKAGFDTKVDRELIKRLAQHGCTDTEILAIAKCHMEDLTKFRDEIQEQRAMISKSLKRTQLEKALVNKDNTMLIWCGKNFAGQSDRNETEIKGPAPQVVFFGGNPKSYNELSKAERGEVELRARVEIEKQ